MKVEFVITDDFTHFFTEMKEPLQNIIVFKIRGSLHAFQLGHCEDRPVYSQSDKLLDILGPNWRFYQQNAQQNL